MVITVHFYHNYHREKVSDMDLMLPNVDKNTFRTNYSNLKTLE